MKSRSYRDIFGGLLLVVIGATYSWHAKENYALGSLRNMGPGLFPATLGLVLAGFGLLISISAFSRHQSFPSLLTWSALPVLCGVGAFALLIRPFGLLPAILATAIISSFADLRIRLVNVLTLCVVISVMAWLIFGVALGLPIPMYNWPS